MDCIGMEMVKGQKVSQNFMGASIRHGIYNYSHMHEQHNKLQAMFLKPLNICLDFRYFFCFSCIDMQACEGTTGSWQCK